MSNPSGGRMTLLLIAGIPLIIILASSWLWFYVASGRLDLVDALGTANRGQLLDPPVALEELQVLDAAGKPFVPTASEDPYWRILVPVGQDCDEACRHLLYYTRQIHTAMGKYQGRIQRILLALDTPPALAEALAEDYPGFEVLYTQPARYRELLAGPAVADGADYFLSDPYGWVMLSYQSDDDGKELMADLKFLLKNSN